MATKKKLSGATMRMRKDLILAQALSGRLTLQVPEYSLDISPAAGTFTVTDDIGPAKGSLPADCEDVPADWFILLTADPRPIVGREQGYIYLSTKGYAANKERLEDAYIIGYRRRYASEREHLFVPPYIAEQGPGAAAQFLADVEAAIAKHQAVTDDELREAHRAAAAEHFAKVQKNYTKYLQTLQDKLNAAMAVTL